MRHLASRFKITEYCGITTRQHDGEQTLDIDAIIGRDDKADRAKLDTLKITLPATALTKGK